jgi:beta-N-acetylhexosaminidase
MRSIRTIALVVWLSISPSVFPRQDLSSPLAPEDRAWVEQTLRQMTLEEKIGQMLVPAMAPVFMNRESEEFRRIERNIVEFHVGGYHAFGGDPVALAALLNRMQRLAKVPLLITADLEGGPGYQFRGATRLPRAMALGATGSEELAYRAGQITAIEGRAMGIHVNFYPVLDVNNNPRNPIINIRSFGEDVALVSRLGQAYIRGAQEHGQLATAKHFPGHGDTSQDSHLELPVLPLGRDRLEQIELPPFRAAIRAGVAAIMTAHIALPQVEPEPGVPATLSPTILTGVLRGELGFQGLIFTDAMEMRGIADHFTPEEATVRAVRAGADVVLFPVDVEKSFTALRQAVERGEIPLERIEASVRRLLEAKARLGLHRNRYVDLDRIETLVGHREHQQWARTMIERALTLVRDDRRVLPLALDETRRVLLLTILDAREGWREGPPGSAFRAELLKRHRNVLEVVIDDKTSRETIEVVKKLADLCDVILANGFIRVAAYKGSIDLTEEQLALLRALSKMEKPFVFTSFGSPYVLTFVPELPTYILTYEYYPEAERAAVRAILGEIPFVGKLPISLPGAYPIGHGLTPTAR